MTELKRMLDETINDGLEQIILSNPIDRESGSKVKIRPVLIKEELLFQETLYRGTKVFHANCTADEIKERVVFYLSGNFRQAEVASVTEQTTVLVSKRGKITVKRKQVAGEKEKRELQHNRQKKYILEEGRPVDFLIGLGVQTEDGKIVKSRYDKFKQINRYLEFVEDVLQKLPNDKTVRIIDFGCGKSYLTFAMYYYLHELKGYDVSVTGLDLKTDVIKHCNETAEKYGYDHLHFELGDINGYKTKMPVDMVVTLHACDMATDYALFNAVQWNAKYILSVPCCQHEVNGQIESELLAPMMEYGIIKERMAALATDAIRANMLTYRGYKTQILEFVDFAHSPKNLLIRAVKSAIPKEKRERSLQEVERMCEEMHIVPSIYNLLK